MILILTFIYLMTVILFLGGMQLLALGIIGEYLSQIFHETKHRPIYLIDEYNGARMIYRHGIYIERDIKSRDS